MPWQSFLKMLQLKLSVASMVFFFLGFFEPSFASQTADGQAITPAPKRTNKRKAAALDPVAPLPFEVTRNDILGFRDSRPIPDTDWMIEIPSEIWAQIFKHTFGKVQGFFVGLTICKHFFAILHNHCNFLLADFIKNENDIFNLLWNRNLQLLLNRKMFGILRTELLRRNRYLVDGRYRAVENDVSSFFKKVFQYSNDAQLISDMFAVVTKAKVYLDKIFFDSNLHGLPVYRTGYLKYFYIPAEEHQKLLELVEPKLVAAAISITHEASRRTIFVPSLLVEYIIPSFFDKALLTEKELKTLREILKSANSVFRDYFNYLLWGCYFISGEKRKDEKSTILPISSHLEHLGFDWSKLFYKFPSKKEIPTFFNELDISRVFRIAKQWGLDINQIAWNTQSWCKLSTEIMANELPDYLSNPEPNAYKAVIQVLCKDGDRLILQELIENGFFDAKIAPQGVVPQPRCNETPKTNSIEVSDANLEMIVELQEIDEEILGAIISESLLPDSMITEIEQRSSAADIETIEPATKRQRMEYVDLTVEDEGPWNNLGSAVNELASTEVPQFIPQYPQQQFIPQYQQFNQWQTVQYQPYQQSQQNVPCAFNLMGGAIPSPNAANDPTYPGFNQMNPYNSQQSQPPSFPQLLTQDQLNQLYQVSLPITPMHTDAPMQQFTPSNPDMPFLRFPGS